GARVLPPLLERLGRGDVHVVGIENRFFGGNISVAGLLVAEVIRRALKSVPRSHRVLLPDVCLSGDRFLDGFTLEDLGRPIEVLETSGAALRRALLPSTHHQTLQAVAS
ncbi:MAG: DUF512 domain-containing protein, partial [Actinomycetota bacterium]